MRRLESLNKAHKLTFVVTVVVPVLVELSTIER